MFAGLYSVMDSFWKQSSPCRRRRQELGVNNPPLDKEDFDLEEGGFLLSDRVYVSKNLTTFEWLFAREVELLKKNLFARMFQVHIELKTSK